ncbi:MAG TPA: methyltransferase domain-containing protein [Candidatus Dormibacteraeota bacterium]|nr:methyltransferase domain-containing protein [Candidatus Dormibacteraeota bacterium]
MTSERIPLHRRAPLTRFSERAANYALHRPTYPAAAIDAVLAGLGDPRALRVADIGAGTGIAARLLGDRGMRVDAVEPNEAMRRAAAEHPRVVYREGTAERTGLDGRSVDLVTAFQAYHWFDPESAHREFARILAPRGRVAIVWNLRDESDSFTHAYGELIRAAAADKDVESRHGAVEPLRASPLFAHVRTTTAPHGQRLDLPGLRGRVESASYVPHAGEARDRLRAELARLHARWADAGGFVRLVYRTEVTLAEAEVGGP